MQLYEHIGENIDGNAYANMLLNKYKTKSRTLKICTFGDISMRAGTIINVNLDIGDLYLTTDLLSESVNIPTKIMRSICGLLLMEVF